MINSDQNKSDVTTVALLTSAYPVCGAGVVGGVEGVCHALAQGLARLPGLEVHVFVAFGGRYGFKNYARLRQGELTIHVIPPVKPGGGILNYFLFDPNTLFRHAGDIRFDLIHVQNEALWAARASGLPRVLTIHGFNERDTLFRGWRLTRRVRGLANAFLHGQMRRRVPNIIAISPYVRQFLKPNSRQRVWDIENPVAEGFFDVLPAPVAGRLLFGGTICPRKNVKGLIKGFALAAKDLPDAELRIAGAEKDKSYAFQCRQLAVGLGIDRRVKFLGSLSVEQMQAECARASLFTLCSFQETAPLVIAEAMAAGVPVVASGVCGIPWMIKDGVTGRLVNPSSPEDIARGLRLLSAPHELRIMGVRAKNEAAQKYQVSQVARQTGEVYRHILNGEQKGR